MKNNMVISGNLLRLLFISLAVCLSVIISFKAFSESASNTDSHVEELEIFKNAIRQGYDSKQQAYATGNVAILEKEFYAATVVLVAEGEAPPLYGREEVIDVFRKLLPKRSKATVTSIHTHLASDGRTGYDLANVMVYSVDDPEPSLFKELFVWELIDDKWRVTAETAMSGEYPSK